MPKKKETYDDALSGYPADPSGSDWLCGAFFQDAAGVTWRCELEWDHAAGHAVDPLAYPSYTAEGGAA
jgi:hypothetical protein